MKLKKTKTRNDLFTLFQEIMGKGDIAWKGDHNRVFIGPYEKRQRLSEKEIAEFIVLLEKEDTKSGEINIVSHNINHFTLDTYNQLNDEYNIICKYNRFPDTKRWHLVFTYYVEKDAWTVEKKREEYIYE